jgi:hypothetical protein
MTMKTCTITVSGKQDGDIELGIEEALRRIKQGNTSGSDSNDDGSFRFEVEGEEEPVATEDVALDAVHPFSAS